MTELDTYLALRTAVAKEPFLIHLSLMDSSQNACAIGSLIPRNERIIPREYNVFPPFVKYVQPYFKNAIDDARRANDSFCGTNIERKAYMLEWLDERIVQLSKSASDLVVPTFEEPVLV